MSVLSAGVSGISNNLTQATKDQLNQSVDSISQHLEAAKTKEPPVKRDVNNNKDLATYYNIAELINGSKTNNGLGGFDTLLDNLHAKNKKYFSIIKDYELMPILIPQINRVLMFLVNECISPDIQNDETFRIKYTGDTTSNMIQTEIDNLKSEYKLDTMLRDVYTNRYKLGKEYYSILDYSETFTTMLNIMDTSLNETTGAPMYESFDQFVDDKFGSLSESINEATITLPILTLQENSTSSAVSTETKLSFKDLNIVLERSSISRQIDSAKGGMLAESYSSYKASSILESVSRGNNLNESTVVQDNEKFRTLVSNLKDKKLRRATILRMDPARIFKLTVGGKDIGYFHVADIENNSGVVNFSQSLKDQLTKTRAANISASAQTAEEIMSKEISAKIIDTFDPNIGISRIEDIDLLHDFVRNNKIYKGDKRITFYYTDEIFDLSRAGDSILTNAVFFTKLYSTLMLNNIMTKVLRGRGRQIHTVKLGASSSVQRYIENAIHALDMPAANLGTMSGSFEQTMNPFNGSGDIIIPTEDDTDRFINTDYIPGQDIDMNDDFLRSLVNAIVSSFGLDSAVIDTANGNLQFARSLTMESLQICSMIKNEQQDLHDNWENMCLEVLRIAGSDDLVSAIANEQVKIQFFEPKSLVIQNTMDDLNNAKGLVESVADIIPELNMDGNEGKRDKFIYQCIKSRTNLDFSLYEDVLTELGIDSAFNDIEAEIQSTIADLKDNTKQVRYGDSDGDGVSDGGSGMSQEEAEIMGMEDEDPDSDDFDDEGATTQMAEGDDTEGAPEMEADEEDTTVSMASGDDDEGAPEIDDDEDTDDEDEEAPELDDESDEETDDDDESDEDEEAPEIDF